MPLLRPVGLRAAGAISSHQKVPWWTPYLRFVPSLPAWARWRTSPPTRAWRTEPLEVPAALLDYPGWKSDPSVEEAAFCREPLHHLLIHDHPEITNWLLENLWRNLLFVMPRVQRALRGVAKLSAVQPHAARRGEVEPAMLTREIKEIGRRVGISAVGVTAYDPKYQFVEYAQLEAGNHTVIVCILEENYGAQLTAPSMRSDRATFSCYVELAKRERAVARHLHRSGFRAHVHDFDLQAVAIPYAVAAGLGQLGLNGQLLTPHAGSRCRIMLISTDAPLLHDTPVDFGIPAICDRCRACVRRCPAKALSAKRAYYRGVWKSKLNMARCLPVLASHSDCDICTTVCPVQRYGLPAVYQEFERSGGILGRFTDDLEGYDFAGVHYPPGRRPELSPSFFEHDLLAVLHSPKPDPPAIPGSPPTSARRASNGGPAGAARRQRDP
jgi:ferredoxin